MVKQVYAVYHDIGTDVRRIRGQLYGIYTDRDVADVAAEKKGWYGDKGIIQERFALQIGEKFYLMDDLVPHALDFPKHLSVKEKRRQQLLRTMAKTERELLEFEDPLSDSSKKVASPPITEEALCRSLTKALGNDPDAMSDDGVTQNWQRDAVVRDVRKYLAQYEPHAMSDIDEIVRFIRLSNL
jgi:hypothetical protein